MDKLLSDYRREIGNFEVVDMVDEEQIAALREKVDIDVPMDLH